MTTSLPQFDPLLHQPLRTQIAAFLAARGEATFSELKQALEATDGNLDAHLTKFIDAGYVKSRKQAPASGRAQTVFCLTPAGRKALAAYIAQLHALMALGEAAPTASKRLKPA
uniref:Putative transcriptional regulator n=1 Tax=mine drainage metagenome TaxID=410659 RepID=E6PU77_9ZZZZ